MRRWESPFQKLSIEMANQGVLIYNAQHTKRGLLLFADNIGPDQQAHLQFNLGIFCL